MFNDPGAKHTFLNLKRENMREAWCTYPGRENDCSPCGQTLTHCKSHYSIILPAKIPATGKTRIQTFIWQLVSASSNFCDNLLLLCAVRESSFLKTLKTIVHGPVCAFPTDFCWMCLGDWKTHGSEYYECSRYKENPDIVNQSQQAQAREALKKYLFYFERVSRGHTPTSTYTEVTGLVCISHVSQNTVRFVCSHSELPGAVSWAWRKLQCLSCRWYTFSGPANVSSVEIYNF